MSFRLALQIPNFSYGTGVENLFPTVIAQAAEADSSGYGAVFVMDHSHQPPGPGTPDQPMLEAYTALGALATATENVQLGTLVTGNTYRNPTLLAKAVTTLDVVSAGRAILGIGTGWFKLEHDSLGYEFGTFTERFDKLDEALAIIVPMLHGERPTFTGKYYRVDKAMAEPRYRDHIPLMIGGSGEKKTIPLAAAHFDHLTLICGFDELAHKTEVARRCCEELGRDPATLATSVLATVVVDENFDTAQLGERSNRTLVGSVESIAEQVQAKVLDNGVTGIVFNIPFHRPGDITALGEALAPLLRG